MIHTIGDMAAEDRHDVFGQVFVSVVPLEKLNMQSLGREAVFCRLLGAPEVYGKSRKSKVYCKDRIEKETVDDMER